MIIVTKMRMDNTSFAKFVINTINNFTVKVTYNYWSKFSAKSAIMLWLPNKVRVILVYYTCTDHLM